MTTTNEPPYPSYTRISQWIKEYGVAGSDDQRSIVDFLEIEAHEAIQSLRGELFALSNGRYTETTMDKLVGPARRQRHGSYEEWAKVMLRWMAKA